MNYIGVFNYILARFARNKFQLKKLMKTYFCALALFFVTTSSIFAQVNFEKGYFITENGQKTECYIKNEGWQSNPSKFEYKQTLDGDVKVLRTPNLKSIVINNVFKFEKHTVQLDDSDRSIGKLKYERSPNLSEKTVLLSVLIEGESTLYSYVDGNIKAFYYKKDNEDIKLLIYKVYTNDKRDVLYNKRYQQQLLTEFPCETISEKTILKVDYNTSDLISFFTKYNECQGETIVQYRKTKHGVFHLKAMAGAYNSYATNELGLLSFYSGNLDTETEWSPTFGLELEYVFPFNKNKWSMFIAPNYSSHKGEGRINDLLIERVFSIEYTAIQIPIGFRHSMFLNDDSKIFLNVAAVVDIPLTQENSGYLSVDNESFKTTAGLVFGAGYNYDKYSIEFRYIPARELLEKSSASSVKLTQFGIILGYTIF